MLNIWECLDFSTKNGPFWSWDQYYGNFFMLYTNITLYTTLIYIYIYIYIYKYIYIYMYYIYTYIHTYIHIYIYIYIIYISITYNLLTQGLMIELRNNGNWVKSLLLGLTRPLLSSQAILEHGTEMCKGLKKLDTKSSVQGCRAAASLKYF